MLKAIAMQKWWKWASPLAGMVALATIATIARADMIFNGSTSGTVTVGAQAAAGTGTNFKFPSTNGTTGGIMYNTDGAGTLGWSSTVVTNLLTLSGTGQAYTGGVHPTAFSNGTASSGTTTIDCGNGMIQTLTNGGSFTLAMSANDGSCVVRVTNNGSAGTITFSGFSQGSNSGDALTTANASKFDISLTRIGGNPHYLVSALQ